MKKWLTRTITRASYWIKVWSNNNVIVYYTTNHPLVLLSNRKNRHDIWIFPPNSNARYFCCRGCVIAEYFFPVILHLTWPANLSKIILKSFTHNIWIFAPNSNAEFFVLEVVWLRWISFLFLYNWLDQFLTWMKYFQKTSLGRPFGPLSLQFRVCSAIYRWFTKCINIMLLTWQLKVALSPGYTVTLSIHPGEKPGGELTQVL